MRRDSVLTYPVYGTLDVLPRIIQKALNSSKLNSNSKKIVYETAVGIRLRRTELYWAKVSFNGALKSYRNNYNLSVTQPGQVPANMSKALFKLLLYTESIYYLGYSILDLSTLITKEIHKGLPYPSFDEQRKKIINSKVDCTYARFLVGIASWFCLIKKRRDDMVHYVSSILTQNRPLAPVGFFSRNKTGVPINDVVNDIYRFTEKFLRFFDRHFSELL